MLLLLRAGEAGERNALRASQPGEGWNLPPWVPAQGPGSHLPLKTGSGGPAPGLPPCPGTAPQSWGSKPPGDSDQVQALALPSLPM